MEDQVKHYVKNFIETGETGFIKDKNNNDDFLLYSKVYKYIHWIKDKYDIIDEIYNKKDKTYNIHYARCITMPDDE